MTRPVAMMVSVVALFSAHGRALATEGVPEAEALDIQIELDPVLDRLLRSPDAVLIKVLHDRPEKALLANLGIKTDRNGVAIGRFQRKKLVFHRAYEVRGEHRHVFVYDPGIHSWPGTQPQTIVICDAAYRPLNWKEVGGSPVFETATLTVESDNIPVLRITRQHRHTIPNPKRGIYSFSLSNDSIERLADVEWLYENEEERARYDRWRKALRERQQTNRPNAVAPTHAPELGGRVAEQLEEVNRVPRVAAPPGRILRSSHHRMQRLLRKTVRATLDGCPRPFSYGSCRGSTPRRCLTK